MINLYHIFFKCKNYWFIYFLNTLYLFLFMYTRYNWQCRARHCRRFDPKMGGWNAREVPLRFYRRVSSQASCHAWPILICARVYSRASRRRRSGVPFSLCERACSSTSLPRRASFLAFVSRAEVRAREIRKIGRSDRVYCCRRAFFKWTISWNPISRRGR